MTLRQLTKIEEVADPWDLNTYIKQAMVYRRLLEPFAQTARWGLFRVQ